MWLLAEFDDDRHPDLHEAEHLYGVAHTTGGRRLPRFITAATPEEQEARLADPAGWQHHIAIPPSQKAIQGARQYAAARGLPDPHQVGYENVMQDPDTVRATGRAYDALPNFDPAAVPHYEAMRREVNDQYNHMTKNMGINVETVDHDPYPDVHHMMNDVENNNRLQVLGTHVTGSHPYFSDEDNDKFRAVHDYFGHAATGRSFDRHGEQAAYLAHSQMFSPQARPALASETKGQNSSLILNGQFGPQKIATLPQEMHNDSSLGAYSPGKVASRWYTSSFGDEVMHRLKTSPHGMTTKRDMRPNPKDGYMVSDRDAEDVVPEHEMNADRANQYADSHPAIDTDEEAHYGLWHEPAPPHNYYQDTSRKFDNIGPHDHDSATDQAIGNGQIAVWDNRQERPYNTSDLVGSGSANAIGFYHGNRRWYRW